ncbi:MAG: hypothetical protein E7661_05825 [Ruminococcaceae bacterium]|nr:hypothetical protein [Oscillospiraceae bacterium]
MKRIFVIALVFCIISIPFLTGCSVTCGEESCRGWGYELGVCYAGSCSDISVDKSWSSMFEIYDLAVEGEDYSKPQIEWIEYSQEKYGTLKVSMDIYQSFRLHDFEILFIQDGIILDTVNIVNKTEEKSKLMQQGTYSQSFTVSLANKNDTGGEVYYIINSFIANRKR